MSGDDEIDVPGAGAPTGPKSIGPLEGPQIDAAAPVEGSDEVIEIAAALASGRVDPAAAQALLIDRVLTEQLPAGLSPAQIEVLREEMSALLGGDPTLAKLLDPR